MAHSVSILSKYFIEIEKLILKIQAITQKQKNDFSREKNDKLTISNSIDFLIEIYFYDKNEFNESINENYFVIDYGRIMSLTVFGKDAEEDNILLPFLRELFEYYPELLVYNDETPFEVGSYIYTKSHLDNFLGTDSYILLGNPPQNLNNIT